MSPARSRLLVILLAHCAASYVCVAVICLIWIAAGGTDWGSLLWSVPFAPIVFPFLTFLALCSLATASLGSQELAWPIAAIVYIPLFFLGRRLLSSQVERHRDLPR